MESKLPVEEKEVKVNLDLLDGKLGEIGKYSVKFTNAKLQVDVDASVSLLSGHVCLAVDAEVVLRALAKAIPGKIDDALIEMIISELKK